MAKQTKLWPSEWTVPLLLSLLVHVAVVALMLFGMHFKPTLDKPMQVPLQSPTPEQPDNQETVQAVTVDQAAVEKRVNEIREQKRQADLAEQRRQAELERKAEAARKAREAEQQRLRELQAEQEAERRRIAKEKAEAEKQKEAAEKAAAEAEARRKREEAAAAKAEAERKRKEEEARKAEEERKRREQEARERAERERQLQEELRAEEAARARARSQQMQSEVQRYTALITQTIQRNWITDDSMRGKECVLTISVAPSGFVKSVNQGEGDPTVCQSARNAVLKANTLPVSQDPEVYKLMETIELTVAPKQ